MFRPAKLGRDPNYALTDPGHEHVPGLSETFHGPLAETLGVAGQRATLDARTHLYEGRTPDGTRPLLSAGGPANFRPAIGGNYHASKSLKAWMAEQPDAVRKKAERALLECCAEAAQAALPQVLVSRTGHAGKGERVPAEGMWVLFLHLTDSAGQYHPHVLVEVHNAGRNPDGKARTLESRALFRRQGVIGLEAEARVVRRFHQEFGLVLRPGPNQALEVKGMEKLRGVKTPRQEEILAELQRRGKEATAKAKAWAARVTHRTRDQYLTVAQAVANTRKWLQARAVSAKTAIREAPARVNELLEAQKAEAALRAAAQTVNRVGRPVNHGELSLLAKRAGLERGADPNRIDALTQKLRGTHGGFGLVRTSDGRFTTYAIERSLAKARRTVERLAKKRAKPPSRQSFLRLAVALSPAEAHAVTAAKALRTRATTRPAPDSATRVLVDAYRAEGRTVYAAGPDRTSSQIRLEYGVTPESTEAFAQRLGKTPWADAFSEGRKRDRGSLANFVRAVGRARTPALELKKRDLVVLDTREANAHAVRQIVSAAKRAGAALVVIGGLEPHTPARVREREPERERDRA